MDSTEDTLDSMTTTDVQAWGESEDLSPDILNALQDNGFNCLDDLKEMGLSDIKECFLREGLLNLQQCLALRNALHRFHAAAGSDDAETPACEDTEATTSGALTLSSGEEPEEDPSCGGACSKVAVCPRVLDSTLRSFQLSPPATGRYC
ncbi:hypothetical protein V1264_003807 [Littorina saxatilis]|uniref:SAM domain-containing protein n=1 Tax=Littorina saxatilis TaxID=31220 RepID=A0AAN9G6R6_9CAEN